MYSILLSQNSKYNQEITRLKDSLTKYETSYTSAINSNNFANAKRVEKHLEKAKENLAAYSFKNPKTLQTKSLAEGKAQAQFWLRVILLVASFVFLHALVDRKRR